MAIFFVSGLVGENIVLASNLVNINTASKTEILETLTGKGIGEAKAQAIVDYRIANGPYSRIEDVMNVSGIGEATFAKIKDFITVGDSSGGGGTDTDTDTNTDTDTGTATTTQTATTTTSTTTTTTNNSNNVTVIYSAHSSQENLSDYTEPVDVFKVSAGRERLSYIRQPINFEAKFKMSNDVSLKRCKYVWSFGDGLSAEGEEVEHIYKYAGDYNVVLNGTCKDLKSISRTTVKVLAPNLVINKTSEGLISILNLGQYEMNLYGYKIFFNNKLYTFPLDTIISAGKNIIFPAEYLQILESDAEISLVDSSNFVLASVAKNNLALGTVAQNNSPYALKPAPVVSPVSAVVNNPNPSPIVESKKDENFAAIGGIILNKNPAEPEDDIIGKEIEVKETIGFWSKIFHPIRTIKEAFYQ